MNEKQPLSAKLGLSARMVPRLVVGGPMTLPGVMDVDTGSTMSVSAGSAMRFTAEAHLHSEQEKPRVFPGALRDRRTSIEWNQWQFGTIQVGALVGTIVNAATHNVIGYAPMATGGAVVMYAWGTWRWWDEQR